MAYRIEGKGQTGVIGPYPAVSLAEARLKRDAIKAQLRAGVNPAADRKPAKHVHTIDTAHEAHWGGRKDLSPSYLSNESLMSSEFEKLAN